MPDEPLVKARADARVVAKVVEFNLGSWLLLQAIDDEWVRGAVPRHRPGLNPFPSSATARRQRAQVLGLLQTFSVAPLLTPCGCTRLAHGDLSGSRAQAYYAA